LDKVNVVLALFGKEAGGVEREVLVGD